MSDVADRRDPGAADLLVQVVLVTEDPLGARARTLAARLGTGADVLRVVAPGAATGAVLALRPKVCVIGEVDDPLAVVGAVMADAPLPVLVLGDAVLDEALHAAGALALLPVPRDEQDAAAVHRRLGTLAGVTVVRHQRGRRVRPAPGPDVSAGSPVVLIGASTGGPAALPAVLESLHGSDAAVLVVQHLRDDLVEGFAAWLDSRARNGVRTATAGELPTSQVVLVAPGGQHLRVDPDGRCCLRREPASMHRPSIDELFDSAAVSAAARRFVGVLLTGMGDDGAQGLLRLRRAGGRTFAQDEATSAVWGMPRAALRVGAVDAVHPLSDLGAVVRRVVDAAGGG